jgi:ribosome-binding factor A
LREVLADQLERLEDFDERLGLLTITAVSCDTDFSRALVLFSSMTAEEEEALQAVRIRLQSAISAQVRLKRTPLLRFAADPAVAAGQRIEEIIRELPEPLAEIDEEREPEPNQRPAAPPSEPGLQP